MTFSPPDDPMERFIFDALSASGLSFIREPHPQAKSLDFYIPSENVYIEVKQFHSPRICAQMARVDNIIAAQGREAVVFLAQLLRDS